MDGREHDFGGRWTEAKLEALRKYLHAYNQALKHQPFRRAYIDAFAGTGYRREPRGRADRSVSLLFPDLAGGEATGLRDGSARIALQVEPPFHQYRFIEKDPQRCAALERLREAFPERADAIRILQGDANEELRALCAKDWRQHRAVLFLDPYGMQVEWETIASVAGTQAIDLWLLFPLGMGLNRMLPRSGQVPEAWARRITALLGTDEWREHFYRTEAEPDLFGENILRTIKASMEEIGRYFLQRLQTVFAGVAPEPLVLTNSRGSPLYLLCFAIGNERGADIGLRIANDILRRLR
jgi:three-Cys-motif partner protein